MKPLLRKNSVKIGKRASVIRGVSHLSSLASGEVARFFAKNKVLGRRVNGLVSMGVDRQYLDRLLREAHELVVRPKYAMPVEAALGTIGQVHTLALRLKRVKPDISGKELMRFLENEHKIGTYLAIFTLADKIKQYKERPERLWDVVSAKFSADDILAHMRMAPDSPERHLYTMPLQQKKRI